MALTHGIEGLDHKKFPDDPIIPSIDVSVSYNGTPTEAFLFLMVVVFDTYGF
jgi:hypothetical protein